MERTPKNKRPRPFLAFALLLFGGYLLFSGISSLFDNKQQILLPRGRINAEFVSTPELLKKGLSGRQSLGRNSGMMFVFENETVERCFWMKDMNFAIDMVWLDSSKEVVHVESNVTPETYPESFCPDQPAQYVLEISTGQASDFDIKIGDALRF